MRNLILITFMTILLGCSSTKKELDNTFYVFNNCVRNLPNSPEGFETQAKFIKELGFDGFGGHISEDYFKRRAALDKAGLKMPEIYWGAELDSAGKFSYKEGLKDIIIDSKDRDLLVALFTNAKTFMNNKDAGDIFMANGIRELADFAAPYGVKVAVYPHVGNYCETSAHSVKLAKMVDRDNAGVIFNTCHLLKVEGEDGWQQKALDAIPHLFMVSINGADSGNTQEMGWDRLIQPLGEGTFDTYPLVKFLKDNGYEGVFGLQCYNIKQDCKVALTKSINTWREYQKRYSEGR